MTPAGRLRILVAEDNPATQLMLQTVLQRLGHATTIVGDGAGAVAATAAGDHDLVLMDCQMPVLDGLQATAAIRERERVGGSRRLPVVAVTAFASAGDRERCLAAGMDAYLTKPVTERILAETIAALTAADRPAATPESAPPAGVPAARAPTAPVVHIADPEPAAAIAQAAAIARLGIAATPIGADHAGPWGGLVLVACRGDGGWAAATVRRIRSAVPGIGLLVTAVDPQGAAAATALAAGADALAPRPLPAQLLLRHLARIPGMPPLGPGPLPGRPLAGPDRPALVLATLRMVEEAAPGTADQMLQGFLGDLDQITIDLAAAVRDDDRAIAARLAHRLRGGAASLGAM
ncbi:MAG: hypothetical protein RLZZ127_417, partial [Planctomycetota bacterium]